MSFEGDIDNAFKAFGKQLHDHTIRIANDAHSSVVRLSPVDTGFFRTSWEYYPMEYPEINIRNNTEYGPALENGHSKQAPHGMVQATVDMLGGKYG